MAVHEIDLEKQPVITTTALVSPREDDDGPKTPLGVYKLLVGDVHAKADHGTDDIYHNIIRDQRSAHFWYISTGIAFGICVALQIVLCLGIAAGAQIGLSNDQITILASVNTAVAAVIAVLKGLGLPEKKAVERYKLKRIADKIRFTTRKLRAGLDVDAAAEAETVRQGVEQVEDEAEVIQKTADLPPAPPAAGDDAK